MHSRFPFVLWHIPLRERYEPRRFCLVRSFGLIFDDWGWFRRTFSPITNSSIDLQHWFISRIGKLAESSDKSERGEPVCPNIRPNFSWVKVRTWFPQSDLLEKSRVLFKRKDVWQIFISCLSTVRFGGAMSSMVSGLSEDSAWFPSIGTDLSEPSANLPAY